MDIKDWIDKFFDQTVEASKQTLKEIEKFTVVWFIFEKYFCEKEASFSKLEFLINKVKRKQHR